MTDDSIVDSGTTGESQIQKVKKRRLHGACDACRKKKIKCDSAEMPGTVCSNCQVANLHCSHDIPRPPKKSEVQQAYIRSLEEKVEKMQRYFELQHAGEDIDDVVNMATTASRPASSFGATSLADSCDKPDSVKYPIPKHVYTSLPKGKKTEDDSDASDSDDLAHIALAHHLDGLPLNAVDEKYFGPSSSFMFTKHASTVKNQFTGAPNKLDAARYRRPIFWDMRPWETEYALAPETSYIYPENDLLQSLVSLYFEKMNPLLPVIHRPSFMKSLAIGQHLWDQSFGMTVLLVCALGARYSHDPRITVPSESNGWLSSGWEYFSQIPLVHRRIMVYKTTVYDLQYFSLASQYLVGTSISHVSWTILAFGLRYAVEKGLHRRMGSNEKPTPQREMQKRAFWAMVCVDRIMSAFLGRPCTLMDEEIDVELPIECDDEYWETEDPQKAFQQPFGIPCSVSNFIYYIRICEILGFALRTLYSTKKSKILSGLIGNDWEGRIVAELDSSLNSWKDSLPKHLRWDAERQDPTFFHQSAVLHSLYYYTQIQVHRPFLSKKSPLSFSSLAMCTNAARSCTHVLEATLSRGARVFPDIIMASFTAGLVIVLNLWGNQRSGLIGNPTQEIENLHKCVNVLRECEKRWHVAGRLCDILNEVGALHEYQPTASKRRRDISSSESSGLLQISPINAFNPLIDGSGPSYSPNSEEQAASTATNNLVPAFDPTMNDWELRDLLFMGMGYLQGNSQFRVGSNYRQQNTAFPNSVAYGENELGQSYQPQRLNERLGTDFSDVSSAEDVFALWADMPAAFSSVEEWDAYLATMNQSQQ